MKHLSSLAMLLCITFTSSPLLANADQLFTQSTSSTTSMITTSTVALIDPAPSSTIPVVTTSTAPIIVPIVQEAPPEASPPSTQTPSSTMLCLAIIAPAPDTGPEWVAFYGLTPSTTDALVNWTLADAQGTILKFTSTSNLLWDAPSQTIRIELKSSRLNNDGDTVTLKTPLGTKQDEYIYPVTKKGERWMRDSCTLPWQKYPLPPPTPPAPDPLPPPSTSSTIVSSTDPITTPTSTVVALPTETVPTITVTSEPLPELPAPDPLPIIDPIAIAQDTPITNPPTLTLTLPPEGITIEAPTEPTTITKPTDQSIIKTLPIEPIKKAAKIKPKPTQSTTTIVPSPSKKPKKETNNTTTNIEPPKPLKKTMPLKKSITKKIIHLTTQPMSTLINDPESYQGMRVRVRGRVASAKNMVGTHRFVIINPDGRGLIIHANGKQPSPTMGSTVDVTGTIVWNDEGLWVKQSTSDAWTAAASEEKNDAPFITRLPDLNAPGQEDAWSSLRVDGVITAIQKTSFDMDTNETTLRIRIPNALKYRVARLSKNDHVRVQGLLDLRSDTPTIIPQTTDMIQIVEHGKIVAGSTSATNPPVKYPWLPVGVAAGTLGVSEGWRRLRDKQKRRREEASFRALTAQLQGSI